MEEGGTFIFISLTMTIIHYRKEPKLQFPTRVRVGGRRERLTKNSVDCWSVLVVTGQVSMANLEHSSQGKKRAGW